MKTITKEVVTKTYQYEAIDGRIFDDAKECEEYEKSYRNTLKYCVGLIPQSHAMCEYDMAGGLRMGSEEWGYSIIIPRDLNDILVLNKYYEELGRKTFGTPRKLSHEDIGKAVLCSGEMDWNGTDHSQMPCESSVEELLALIDRMKDKILELVKEAQNFGKEETDELLEDLVNGKE